MPKLDGTGPMGQGPLTGRGLGPCNTGRNQKKAFTPGRGQARGMGMGMRNGCPYTNLSEEKTFLEKRLEIVKKMIKEEGKDK